MLKSMNFLRGKSRGRVSGGTKSASPAPVILGRDAQSVPRILWQQGSNLVNKLALLLNKCWGRGVSAFCTFFKYPSPEACVSPSPAGGEGWNRPWCDKILGTDCASRPRMTGGRGAGFVRLLRRYTPRNDVFNNTPHSALSRHSLPQGAREHGRSMIEMLGVLAIIAVLSVGGIAGYSKAMMMWKVDKWSAGLIQMMQEAQTLYLNQKSFGDTVKNITPQLVDTGVIPQGMLDENYRDMFGNRLTVLTRYGGEEFGLRLNVYHEMPAGKDAVECCKKLYEMGQQFPSNWVVVNENFGYSVCGRAAPDNYAQVMGCQPYSLAKVAELCKNCETNNCNIIFLLDNTKY